MSDAAAGEECVMGRKILHSGASSCYAVCVNTRISPTVAALALLVSCADPPIVWEEPRPLPEALESTARLVLASDDSLTTAPDSAPAPPVHPAQCPASVRMARDTTGEWYASWWALRPDSTAEVVVARSRDGVAWDEPVRVDTVDAGRTACRRPAPSIDAWGGHVHVAYSMAAREGPGIFATHSMDRGVMFHTPVAVVYGERIGEAAIAARGNTVAIAFEDPNSTIDHIGLAYSNTMAHLFQHRQTVSPTAGAARRPRIALDGNRIAVAWTRVSGGAQVPLVRYGTIR